MGLTRTILAQRERHLVYTIQSQKWRSGLIYERISQWAMEISDNHKVHGRRVLL